MRELEETLLRGKLTTCFLEDGVIYIDPQIFMDITHLSSKLKEIKEKVEKYFDFRLKNEPILSVGSNKYNYETKAKPKPTNKQYISIEFFNVVCRCPGNPLFGQLLQNDIDVDNGIILQQVCSKIMQNQSNTSINFKLFTNS